MRILVFITSLFVSLSTSNLARAQSCRDYFTSEWAETIDMSNVEDVNDSFPIIERSDLSPYVFSGGVFSVTATGNDPFFKLLTRAIDGSIADRTTRYGNVHPIDSATYKQLVIRMYTDRASGLQVFWEKADNTLGSTGFANTSPGWNTYVVNLDVGNWSNGPNYSLRVDPANAAPGAVIQIDYIYLTPAGCSNPDTRTAPVIQPDREGGEDYFAALRGNPANFDSPNDIEYLGGHSSMQIHPSESYTDSAGRTRRGDFFRGVNDTSDPVVYFAYPGTRFPIDARLYRIACYTIDLLRPVNEWHSVVRLIWQRDGHYYNTDDVLTRLTGESRYCLRMDSVPLEPSLPNGSPHPWANNSDGSGLDIFRLDALEDSESTAYRLADFRLAADHAADSQFAVVIGGDRTASVTVEYQKDSDPRGLIGTLPANRATDVLLWNTASLAEGTYYIVSTIGSNSIRSEAPVVIAHSARSQDSTAPLLNIDSPRDGHRFSDSLQVAGYALDNRRIATVEVHLDGQFIDAFRPGDFDRRARDAYASYPFSSSAGFDRLLDMSAWPAGSHVLTVTAYDTSGNHAIFSSGIEKTGSNLTPRFVAPFSEDSPVQMKDGLQPRQPGGGAKGKASLSLSVSGSTLRVSAKGRRCSVMRLFASISGKTKDAVRQNGTLLQTSSGNKLSGSARKIPHTRRAKRVYFLADCGDGTGASLQSVNLRSFRGRAVNSADKVYRTILKRYRPS